MINDKHKINYVNNQVEFLHKQNLRLCEAILKVKSNDDLITIRNSLKNNRYHIEVPKINEVADFDTKSVEYDLLLAELNEKDLKIKELEELSQNNDFIALNNSGIKISSIEIENQVSDNEEIYRLLESNYESLQIKHKFLLNKADSDSKKFNKKIQQANK